MPASYAQKVPHWLPGAGKILRLCLEVPENPPYPEGAEDHRPAQSHSGDPPMTVAKPLPEYLIRRYHGWKATTFAENKGWYKRLAEDGQRPRAMVISCCDSRVHVTSIFGADQGEFFIHRNIANLVPPYAPDSDHHGTSAAVEYAVRTLRVSHLIVMGHSGCGGVQGCYDMCSGDAPDLEEATSFIGRWMDILRPGFERLEAGDRAARLKALEKASVLISIENLPGFPFVREAVEEGMLSIHGLWNDIGDGSLLSYDPEIQSFIPI
jgi:carbonic anhydrase